MDRSVQIGAGVVAAGLAGLLLWRRHVRAGLPGSVEPDQGGLDEAPEGTEDAKETENSAKP